MKQVPLNRTVLINRLAEMERDGDLEIFAKHLKELIAHPGRIGLTIQ